MTSYLKCPGCKSFVDIDKYAEHVEGGHKEGIEEAKEVGTLPPEPKKQESALQSIDRLWHTPHIKRPLLIWSGLMILVGLILSRL